MFHARRDYNRRVQDSEGLIPDEEPVFLLRAQDPAALHAVSEYITYLGNRYSEKKVPAELIEHLEYFLYLMQQWYDEIRGKEFPDTDTSEYVDIRRHRNLLDLLAVVPDDEDEDEDED